MEHAEEKQISVFPSGTVDALAVGIGGFAVRTCGFDSEHIAPSFGYHVKGADCTENGSDCRMYRDEHVCLRKSDACSASREGYRVFRSKSILQ